MKDLIITDEIKNINIEEKGAKALQTGYFNKTKIAQTGKSYSNEKGLQKVFCQWVKKQYPLVRFISTFDGEEFSLSNAVQNSAMKSHNGAPDFICFAKKGLYIGIAIELKKDGEKIFKKDGTTYVNKHIQEQAEYLNFLRMQGWRAVFAVGLTEAKQQFSYYMSL